MKKPEQATRDDILRMLSDEEAAAVALPVAAAHLVVGEEFIDLAEIERGVQRVTETQRVSGVLRRKAVHAHTWTKIVTNLAARRLMSQPPAPPPPRH